MTARPRGAHRGFPDRRAGAVDPSHAGRPVRVGVRPHRGRERTLAGALGTAADASAGILAEMQRTAEHAEHRLHRGEDGARRSPNEATARTELP